MKRKQSPIDIYAAIPGLACLVPANEAVHPEVVQLKCQIVLAKCEID
jgi:hypothetical protein